MRAILMTDAGPVDVLQLVHLLELPHNMVIMGHQQEGGSTVPAAIPDELQGLPGVVTVQIASRFIG